MRRTAAATAIVCVAASLLTAPSAVAQRAHPVALPALPAQKALTALTAPSAPGTGAPSRPAPVQPDAIATSAPGQAEITGVDPSAAQQPAAADGTVDVRVDGDPRTVAARARALGGRVLISAGGVSSVQLPRTQLAQLGAAAGIRGVHAPVRAFTDSAAVSQGVSSSEASAWQGTGCSGDCGAGVKVAIVDAGFGSLSTEQSAGNMPAVTYTNEGCSTGGQTAGDTQHGTAVAEIVHQMAPQAQLFLYCVADSVGFGLAAADIVSQGVSVVNSSLGFPADSRGDGSGAATSAATAVRNARESGVLWIQSAGNNAAEHWTGSLVDRDHDGLVDLGCDVHSGALSTCPESDAFYTAPGAAPTLAVLKWDGWPTSPITDIKLEIVGRQCAANWASCTGPARTPIIGTHAAGAEPTISLSVAGTSSYMQWIVAIKESSSRSTQFDLSYWGGASDPSYLASVSPAKAAQASVSEPASSPFAFAVGAANVTSGMLERFSSQGPTIDARVKPDITGWDCVSSNLGAFASGFCGTSAAAPHVAGAAALVKAANPSMDAAQIQTFLEQRANGGAPSDPPSVRVGHGTLTLGAPSAVVPPTPVGYTAVAPQRILDTRTSGQRLGATSSLQLSLPGSVPSSATAVAINLTGFGASAATNLAVYAGDTWPGTSNLNLDRKDSVEAVFATVTLDASRSLTVRNQSGQLDVIIDLLGYFDASGTGRYTPLAPTRVLDTRVTHGGSGPIGGSATTIVSPGLPSGAAAAVINVTSVLASGAGDLRLSADCTGNTSTLNFRGQNRANMAIVGLAGDGTFCITADGASTDIVVDVLGYLGATGAGYVALPSPVRIMDTRHGNQAPVGPVPAGQQRSLFGAGIFGVPFSASALMVGVTGVAITAYTDLEVFPGTSRPNPPTSTVNLSPGETVPNAAIGGVDSNRVLSVFNATGSTSVVVDLFGYFA